MPATIMPPIHPGEILLEDFLEPLGLSQYRLAKDTSVSPRRIMKSSTVRDLSQRIQLFALPATSAPRIDSGSTFRCAMIWNWRRTALASGYRPRCRC